jgi:hypothetical protein
MTTRFRAATFLGFLHLLLLLLVHLHVCLVELLPVLVGVLWLWSLALTLTLWSLDWSLVSEEVDDVELALLLGLYLLVVCLEERNVGARVVSLVGKVVLLLMGWALVDDDEVVLVDIVINIIVLVLRSQHLNDLHEIRVVEVAALIDVFSVLVLWLLRLFVWLILIFIIIVWLDIIVLLVDVVVSLSVNIIVVDGCMLVVVILNLDF